MKMLIQYCKSNNIVLIWTEYEHKSLEIYPLEYIGEGYFDSPYLQSSEAIKDKCHLDFSEHKFFDYAADYDFWPPGHWGIHKHIHLAESIYDRYIETPN
jgi:hypothetical protein